MGTGDEILTDDDSLDCCDIIKSVIYCKFVGQLDFGINARIWHDFNNPRLDTNSHEVSSVIDYSKKYVIDKYSYKVYLSYL